MMPECCEKCKKQKKDNCGYFRQCPAWTSWFKQKWDGIRTAAAQIKGERPVEKPKENRAKSSSTSSLCLYTTDPCGAMGYKKGGAE
jgi:hypothetical protein